MIEFRALGPAMLDAPEGARPQSVLARPKLLGLLAVLAAGARGFQRRDSLIGLFWAEMDQERARSAVRQSLYRLRLFLGENVVVTRGDDEVGLSEDEFWCDVAAFEDALDRGDREAALALYRGDLLAGFYVPDAPEFERWLDERRKELRVRASTAAWELADRQASMRNTVAAGRWSRHARNLAPMDERLLRRVIKLLDRLGDRSGAVREYEEFAKRLMDELELEPSPETKTLIDEVRARSVAPATVRTPPTVPITAEASAAVPSPDDAAVMPERSLARALSDRYRIVGEIGAGGMASVYLARDLRHERDVAVKVMRREVAANMGTERFLQEIMISAQLTHPHIVPVYDSGAAAGHLYYVMPHIDGESLRSRLEREGQLPVDEALAIVREVADALSHAHRIGVVHRDIKPENILLSGGHALVTDFGIARAISAAGGTKLTKSGMVMGTPPYMSPEQTAGGREIDGRADLYSLGCVLFEMLGGEPPFTGPTFESIARQHLTTEPRPITDLRPSVPNNVSEAIARALAKSPADRFGSAAEFVEALTAGAAVPRSQRVGKWRKVAVFGGLPVLVLAVAFVVVRLTSAAPLDPNRVVVVPFENRTGDTTLALLGTMAADWITQGLQEIEVIQVVPTATGVEPGPDVAGVARFAGLPDARVAGEAAGAGTVVMGAYYRRADSLEFQAQVIGANGGQLLRAVPPVIGPANAPGGVMDSLRSRVVAAVAAVLDHRLMISTRASPLPALDAYRLYLEGHRAFYHGPTLRMGEALDYLYRAVALDSTFTDPRFLIVFAHANQGELRLADSNAQLLIPFRARFSPYQRATLDWLLALLRGDRAGALEAARDRGVVADAAVEAFRFNRPFEAIENLETVADLSALEFNYFKWLTLMEAYHVVGDHRRELKEARRARQVFPDQMRMLISEVRALSALGRLEDVDRGLDESLLLPVEGGLIGPARALIDAVLELRAHGHRDASLRVAERAIDWFDSRPPAEAGSMDFKVGLAQVLYLAERWEEAGTFYEELISLEPDNVNFTGSLGALAARLGDNEAALRYSEQLEGMADPYGFGADVYWQACIASQLGDLERAMVLLREAYARGRMFTIYLHTDIDLEPLRGYPPFEEFLKPKG